MIDELDIAVIGMAGRFPGAKDLEKYWHNLQNGIESITFLGDEDLEDSEIEPTVLRDPSYVKASAIIEDIEWFDAPFFGLNPKEAILMDPQHRLFLEYAWEALEGAGYINTQDSVGVYAGSSLSRYLFNLYSNPEVIASAGKLLIIGNDKDHLSTRVSYKLNLRGPSYTVQSACSTSLVTVYVACQSLLNSECDIALAGGVSINLPQKTGYKYQED
ncbi:MAG: polyketide synthase, partial [Cyanobacteria bacterium J06635_15]